MKSNSKKFSTANIPIPEKEKKRILADARDQLERWLALEEFIPTRWSTEFHMPAGLPTKIISLDDVENVAMAVRNAWKLGDAAIPDLISTLELHGISDTENACGIRRRKSRGAHAVGIRNQIVERHASKSKTA